MLNRIFQLLLTVFLTIGCLNTAQASTPKSAASLWPYDPSLQPITLTEMRRLIRSPKTKQSMYGIIIRRAAVSRLLEYATVEYDQQRKKNPNNVALQSAFGSCVIGVNWFDWRYKPSSRVLVKQQRNAKFVTEAANAIEDATRGKGMNVAYCWAVLGYMRLTGFEMQRERKYVNFNSAVNAFERAIEIDPKYDSAYALLTRALLTMNSSFNPSRALQTARKATELNPKLSDAYYTQAIALQQLKRSDEANVALKKWSSLLPPNLRQQPAAKPSH